MHPRVTVCAKTTDGIRGTMPTGHASSDSRLQPVRPPVRWDRTHSLARHASTHRVKCCRTKGATRGFPSAAWPSRGRQRNPQLAAHESAKTTKLYDRTNDAITLDEVERIAF